MPAEPRSPSRFPLTVPEKVQFVTRLVEVASFFASTMRRLDTMPAARCIEA